MDLTSWTRLSPWEFSQTNNFYLKEPSFEQDFSFKFIAGCLYIQSQLNIIIH
jgi:hypothetical protein